MPSTDVKIGKPFTGGLRVDRNTGTIYNVKILGFDSENNRRYLPEAVKAAKSLYEGIKVNLDHPEGDPAQSRRAEDRIGKLTNIRYVEGKGLYGNLQLLMSRPMAESICEAAERMPDAYGLSHNAQGEGEEDKDGVLVIRRITDVRHVDLVADPATTRSLAESAMRKISEANAGPFANGWPLEPKPSGENGYKINNKRFDQRNVFLRQSGWVQKNGVYVNGRNPKARLTNSEVMYLSDDHWNALKMKIRGALESENEGEPKMLSDKISEILNGDMDDAAKLDAIKMACDSCEPEEDNSMESDGAESSKDEKDAMEADGEMSKDDEEKKDMEEAEGDSEDPEKKKDTEEMCNTKESKDVLVLRRRLSKLEHQLAESKKTIRVRALCESQGIRPTKELVSDLKQLSEDAQIRYVKKLVDAQRASKPKSGMPFMESVEPRKGQSLSSYLLS